MKELFVTKQMVKFQEQAREAYSRTGKIDTSAVILGWKIGEGRVFEMSDINATIEITGEPQHMLYNVVTNAPDRNIVNLPGQMNILQVGHLILVKGATVHYSK
jgi:hypothetical protein